MLLPFSRTLRALEHESTPRPLYLAVACLALAGVWTAWLTRARIALVETSERARIEVSRVGNAVEAPVSGRLVAGHFALGQRVAQGEVLAQLDSSVVAQRLAEARARSEALAPEMEGRNRQIGAELELQQRRIEHAREAVEAARAREASSEAQAKLASEEASRTAKLFGTRSVSEMENQRAQSEADQKAANLGAARLEVTRLERQRDSEQSESEVRIARLRSEIVDLSSQQAVMAAAVQALTRELESYAITAPVAGEVAETSARQVGAFVQAGERLLTIVPESELRAVADFLPASAVGRVRAGQRARIRLDGFPWTQYGSIGAVVTRVGTEVREGRVRVEFAIEKDPRSAIPLQHGLPGSVEVQVDEVSPWTLVLRVAGGLVAGPRRESPEAH